MVRRPGMRVLVTGASGYLGSRLAAALHARGYDVVGVDREAPLVDEIDMRRMDLCDVDSLEGVLEGVDLVAHCASIHPWKPYTDADYIQCNVQGTWHLYECARRAGIDKVVLTSSIAAAGYSGIPPEEWPVPEETEHPLGEVYSFTKHAQEDAAKSFAAMHGVRTLALRPPAFMPSPGPVDTGSRLLGAYALVEDMVSAHLAAVEVLGDGREGPDAPEVFEAVNTTNALPYRPSDAALIGPGCDLLPLARRYWPFAADWLEQQGYQPGWLPIVYDLSKAKRLLGWEPRWSFPQWFEHRAQRDPVSGVPR
ncbi:MAG: NAD-dependent epimerase/dehydratase family protein [Armatimonadia bacterium]|nr:NAD-dependent epimerase/dehydratase family protein [Armatimonadia bacterium]